MSEKQVELTLKTWMDEIEMGADGLKEELPDWLDDTEAVKEVRRKGAGGGGSKRKTSRLGKGYFFSHQL